MPGTHSELHQPTKDAKILIVDDEATNVLLLESILEEAGYTRHASSRDPRQVRSLTEAFQPDLILLDLMMPEMNGFEVMAQLRSLVREGDYLPILVLTADVTQETKRQALSMGAKDFLTKPFDHMEVLLRIRNLIEARTLHRQLQKQNSLLEEKVYERTRELESANEELERAHAEVEEAQIEILERLARAAEYRDDQTGQHTQRVGQMSAALACALGLSATRVEWIRRAAPLHDVGKIAVPDHILMKPGMLTAEEFEVIKTHTTIGAALLSKGRSAFTRTAERIALTHHERWDGRGYPQGLKGEAIPIEGRIVAVVDVFDALTHERPYKQAWSAHQALDEIERQSGQQFDPAVVEAFLLSVGKLYISLDSVVPIAREA